MKFSIVTCTYNSIDYIQKNIDSVRKQTCDDFEHIFIDGYSNDGTMDIIKQYQKDYPEKVRIFQFEPKGIAHAMNKGIEKASGEYILHLHSDDSLHAFNVLGKVSQFLIHKKNPDWIYGKANFFNERKMRVIPHRNIYKKSRFWLLLITNYIPHQSVFIKKSVFMEFGKFDEQYENSMDYEIWLRLSKNKVEAQFIDEIICNFFIRKNSLSTTGKIQCTYENENIIKKYSKNKILAIMPKIIASIK
jgi:glycosyltransferase involved in cell wall biosynthesis